MTDVDALNRDFRNTIRCARRTPIGWPRTRATSSTRIIEIATLDFGPFLRGDAAGQGALRRGIRRGAARRSASRSSIGHGVDPALYDDMHDAVLDLFTSTPLDEKMRFRAARHGSVNQGYFPIEETSDIHPDLVEGWVWCRRAFDIPQDRAEPFRAEDYWPRAEYERAFRRLVLAHEPLFKPIAQAMLQGLGFDPHVYDGKLTGTNFGLRLNYYPPMSADQDRSGAGRLLGHEDVDLFTILPATRIDGLQVWNHRSGKWVRLQRAARLDHHQHRRLHAADLNDRLPSTTHRVGKPSDGSHLSEARVSFPIAVYVWENEMLEVLPGLGDAEISSRSRRSLPHAQHEQILRRRLCGSGLGLPKNDKWYYRLSISRVVWSADRCPVHHPPRCRSPTSSCAS